VNWTELPERPGGAGIKQEVARARRPEASGPPGHVARSAWQPASAGEKLRSASYLFPVHAVDGAFPLLIRAVDKANQR
jgi:hypothetical protein